MSTKQRYSVKVARIGSVQWVGSPGAPLTGADNLTSAPQFRAVFESRAAADAAARTYKGCVMIDTLTTIPTEAA